MRMWKKRFSIANIALYDGSPLADVAVDTFHSDNGKFAETKTDLNGEVEFKLTDGGNWMFLARHENSGKGVLGEFDEKMVTAVLSLAGVK